MWIAYALIAIGSISIANLFQKLSMKKEDSDPVIAAIVFSILLGIFSGTFALLVGFHLPNKNILPFFVISTAFYAFGTIAFFKAMKAAEASVVIITTGFGAIVSILSAYIFLGERLSNNQLLGSAIILLAVALVSGKKQKEFKLNKGVLYSLIGTSLYALAVTNDTHIILNYEAISYTPIMSFLPVLLLIAIYPQKIKPSILALTKFEKNIYLYSFLYSIQAVSYYLALQHGAMASRMGILFKAQIILSVLLAIIFLKERKNLGKKFLAAILVTIGILLLK